MPTVAQNIEALYGDHATVAAAQRAATQRPTAARSSFAPTCPRCCVPFGEDEPALPGELCVVCAYGAAEPPPVGPERPPVVAEAGCPEAQFSLCLKGRIQGQDAQLTIRAQSAQAFAANVAAVRGLFDTPTAPPTPLAPPSPAAAAAPEPEPTPVCPIHHVTMTRQSNERGWWLSHPTDDGGWCKGKARRGRQPHTGGVERRPAIYCFTIACLQVKRNP
jgi:hypothetical protein